MLQSHFPPNLLSEEFWKRFSENNNWLFFYQIPKRNGNNSP
jgi:hypothetical protein